MERKAKLGIIGLGARGLGLLKGVLLKMSNVQVTAVCDAYEDRAKDGQKAVKFSSGSTPLCTTNFEDVINCPEVELVMITTAWEDHVKIALASMKAGKFCAMEVGGAYSLEDCWALVDTYEKTKVPCMLLENCCYGQIELMVLNMARKGLLGDIVHCSGGYHHDLRHEISFGDELRHYRLRNYIARNCENYPTHELGPIAKILNINRGNRMLSLTSASSCAKGLHEFISQKKKNDIKLLNTTFAQGDIVTTVIKCENGETIVLTLDTTLPRTYSRGFTVRGTKGSYFEDTNMLFLDGKHNIFDMKPRAIWNNARKYRRKFDHPLWSRKNKSLRKGGHGGMDGLVLSAMVDCFLKGVAPTIDVYDTVAWMSIACLSETAIQNNCVVEIPDFTRGKYKARESAPDTIYTLD